MRQTENNCEFASSSPAKGLKTSLFLNQRGGVRVILLLFLLLGTAGYFYKEVWHFSLRLFDRQEPLIHIAGIPAGVGRDAFSLTVKVEDTRSGVHELIVRTYQNGQDSELFRKSYPAGTVVSENIEVSGRELRLSEGEVEFQVIAFDRSLWTNRAEETFSLDVDYTPPVVRVLTTQHNTSQAGASLVFYEIPNKEVTKSGVKAGEHFFPGFKAKYLDPSFADSDSLYFALFPVPMNFDPDSDRLTVYAEDKVGNSNSSGFNYQIRKASFSSPSMNLSERFLSRKLPELLPSYLQLTNKSVDPYSEDPEDMVRNFRLVNENYRYLLEEQLQNIFNDSANERLWSGPFSRMSGAQQMAGYGEHRHYSFQGKDAGQSYHMGVDLASIANSPVKAANNGRVVFADDLGIYGKTVVIDHGFALHTLYGHFSSLLVSEGADVTRDTEIGLSGQTGLAGGDHLHFEVRLHGVPVSPIPWWDSGWIRDHIDNKIKQVAVDRQGDN